MNAKTAERLLPCHLEGQNPGAKESRIQKAAKFAERDATLKARFESQEAFDKAVLETLDTVTVPEGLPARIGALDPDEPPQLWKSPFKNPAVLAAILSLAVIAALVGRGAMERSRDFQGKETALKMIETASTMDGVEFDPINPTELGRLNDWFAMNGMERFQAPPGFETLKAVGCRVYKQSGFPVAQALVEQNDMIVYVFRGADLGLRPDPSGRWQTFKHDEWSGAIRAMDDLCAMIAFRGTEDQMREFLASVAK